MDWRKVEEEVLRFVRTTVAEAEANGVVLGLSGGIDSSVVAALCARTLGKTRVLGVFMPAAFTPSEDARDAESLAEDLGIPTLLVEMTPIVEKFSEIAPLKEKKRVAIGNVYARMRMITNYFVANSLDYLVAGTGNRSEMLMGYFTKYGDGGVDLLPIGHLYKTEVRELAGYLDLPQRLVQKPSSPQLWEGQRATDEIPADYPILDPILRTLFDAEESVSHMARALDVRPEVVQAAKQAFERSHHKRAVPPMPNRPRDLQHA
jgi:NAD+ synthase